jgi:hypothetical protein
MTYKKPCDTMYHVFTNGYDDYLTDPEEVIKAVSRLMEDGHEEIRVYKQTEWNEMEGIFEDGDCIFSLGDFPL